MTVNDFDKFVEESQSLDQNWSMRKGTWLAAVETLYSNIRRYLEDYQGKIQIIEGHKKINENYIGEYEIKTLKIVIGKKTITLDPVGTMIIGTFGRVDMEGRAGQARFVLAPKNTTGVSITSKTILNKEEQLTDSKETSEYPDMEWKIATPPPTVKYKTLDQDTFLNAVMEVANGGI